MTAMVVPDLVAEVHVLVDEISTELAAVRRTVEAAEKPDQVDRWGMDSFPASDPPSNW